MSKALRYLLVVAGLAVFTVAALGAIWMGSPPPPGPDLSRSRISSNGLFAAEIAPEAGEPKQGELHAWVLTLKSPQGVAVEGATIKVGGGMPAHAHGLPTSPEATAYLGEGRYRIDGVKFSMSGLWELRFKVAAPAGADEVVFNVEQ